MWMMGYSEEAGELDTVQDPFTGGKQLLRPLMPRPTRDHFLCMGEQDYRREITTQQVVVSSRWNPTPEQLQTLEELYRRGTRTPSAEQIQQITSQLRRYGKIEGKNVFYWFQNHKARERQKRRRQLLTLSDDNTQKGSQNTEPLRSNKTAFEVEHTKNWASPSNSSTVAVETTQRATKGADQAECESDGWLQFDIDAAAAAQILSQQRRNATWQMHKRPHDNFINIFDLEPYFNPQQLHHRGEEAQTLQLFPIERVHEEHAHEDEEGATMSGGATDHVITPFRFFEFLPLKK